jgi:hypothetical protein
MSTASAVRPARAYASPSPRVELQQRLELTQLVARPPEFAVELGQFLPRHEQARRSSQGLLEALECLLEPARAAQAQSEQVMRLGDAVVQSEGLLEGRDGPLGVAAAVAGERQLVEHARRALVEAQVIRIPLGGAGVVAHFELEVAQELERAGRRTVELPGLSDVSFGGGELALPAVRFAAPQVGHDRVALEGEGAGKRLDRLEGPLVGERTLAGGDQPAIRPVPGHPIVGDGGEPDERGDGEEHDASAHGLIVAKAELLGRGRV